MADRSLDVGAFNPSLDGTAGKGNGATDTGYSYGLIARAGRNIEGNWLGVQVDSTASPTFTVIVEGSLDDVTYYPIQTYTLVGLYFIANFVARYVRARLTALSGGTCKVGFTQ